MKIKNYNNKRLGADLAVLYCRQSIKKFLKEYGIKKEGGTMNIDEKWIKNYENIYSIDKKGIVRSYYNNKIKELKPCIDKDGYLDIKLFKKNKTKHFRIARLVAENFILNMLDKKEVNHINGIKTDNRVENLEWCTRSENEIHAYKKGLANIEKTRSKNSKPIFQIDKVTKEIIKEFKSMKEAENILGISCISISSCCRNKTKTAGKYIWKFKEIKI